MKDIDSGPYGPYITSKTVSLKVDMLFRKSATKVFSVNGKNIQGLRFTFEGGSGPYRVVGILRNGEVYKIDRKDIQVTVSDKGKVYVDIMKELDLYHMNGSKNVIGYYEPYKYEIELKDQYGQTVWGSFKLPN